MTKFDNSFSDVDKIHYLLQNFKPEFFSRNDFIKHVYNKLWRRTHFTKPFVRHHAGQYWDKALDAGRFAQCTLLEDLHDS